MRHAGSQVTVRRMAAAIAIAAAVGVGSATGCGSQDGVVGGACASGYTQCDLSCFDLQTDPHNCGACGKACPVGVACVEGACGGGSPDATVDGGDGSPFDANDLLQDGMFCDVSDPAHPVCRPAPDAGDDGGGDGSGDGNASGDGNGNGDGNTGGDGNGNGDGNAGGDGSANGDGCAPPFDTPANCGSCGNACVAPNDVCSLVDGGFQCVPACAAPLVECQGQCVNVLRDPQNCGACGTTCPSQYCFLATCQGNVAGNVMIIGHDFQKALATDQETKLLLNSVFYAAGAVTLLSYEHYVDAPTVTNALGILQGYATAQHVTLNVQSTKDDTSLANDTLLTSETAVIVWDQPNAPKGALGALGTAWAPHLSKFVQGGGIVIALDAAQGTGEMPALITNAALLAVTGHGTVAPGSPVDVPLAGLGIARGMTSVYGVDANTAWFSTSEPATNKTLFVANVQGQTAQLVAVHRVIN